MIEQLDPQLLVTVSGRYPCCYGARPQKAVQNYWIFNWDSAVE